VFSYHHCTLDGAISRPVALLFLIVWFLHLVWCFTALISTAQEKKTTPSCQWKRLNAYGMLVWAKKTHDILQSDRCSCCLVGWMAASWGWIYQCVAYCCCYDLLHTLYRINVCRRRARWFHKGFGFVCSGSLGVEHMRMIMGYEMVLNLHSLL
jgi:hypothetical protein